MRGAFDVAIVGSGFAGSLLALVARRLGLSVVLLEKGSHPRFAIGESTSPLANLLLEELAARYALPRLLPLAKWGSWRRAYPQVSCGLKRGFTFFHHAEGRPFANAPDRQDQLLVAASPNDEVADTHWYRPEFDHFLLKEAEEAGSHYVDRIDAERRHPGERPLGSHRRARGRRLLPSKHLSSWTPRDEAARFTTRWASGASCPLVPATQGLFTHFEGVRRLEDMGIPAGSEIPPYPIDDAAVHHVFPGGWIWILRFGNGLTSAGVAASDAFAETAGFARGEAAWEGLLERFPTIRDQFEGARPTLPFVHAPRLPFRVDRAAGPGWALLPSAAAFADPLLSTGFPLALLGIHRLAEALERDFGTPRFDARLATYGALTLEEADRAARLVAALYSAFSGLSALRRAVEALLRGGPLLGVRPARRPTRPRGHVSVRVASPVRAGARRLLPRGPRPSDLRRARAASRGRRRRGRHRGPRGPSRRLAEKLVRSPARQRFFRGFFGTGLTGCGAAFDGRGGTGP